MEPLLPELLEDVPLDVRRIVRRNFYAFDMEGYNTRTLIFLSGGRFFWPACSLQLVALIVFSGDISDVYLPPLRDFSRARES